MNNKIIIQSDFDGTLTQEDTSFLILDKFAKGDWRKILEEYRSGKISVGQFNARAFAMVRASKDDLTFLIKEKARLREDSKELIDYLKGRGFRFVIVSNGLEFYIRTMLEAAGINNVEVYASGAIITPEGIITNYTAPAGGDIDDGFKEAYTRYFKQKGYTVIYIGNGPSDAQAARLADFIFATDALLEYCQQEKLNFAPFATLDDIITCMRTLPLANIADTVAPLTNRGFDLDNLTT